MAALDPVTQRDAIIAKLGTPGMLLVACLCAAWCGTCREYQQAFDALADSHPEMCFVWVDIEDHADWLDDHDIENFPTILIQDQQRHRFFGTVLPFANILERMLSDPATLGSDTPRAPDLRGHLTAPEAR